MKSLNFRQKPSFDKLLSRRGKSKVMSNSHRLCFRRQSQVNRQSLSKRCEMFSIWFAISSTNYFMFYFVRFTTDRACDRPSDAIRYWILLGIHFNDFQLS